MAREEEKDERNYKIAKNIKMPLKRPCVHARSFQSCPALCDPMNYSLPGSSVHGILQARMLEWVAVSSSSQQRSNPSLLLLLHWQTGSLSLAPPTMPFGASLVAQW